MDEDNLPLFPRYGPPVEEPAGTARPPTPPVPAPRPNDREQRLAALRALAGQPATASATPSQPAQASAGASARSPRRALLAALTAILLLAGSVGTYLHSRPPASTPATTPSIPTTVTLNAGTGHVGCPSRLAWSPDGQRMAVLAVKGNSCAATEPVGLIFDTRTGQQLASLDLTSQLTAGHLSGVITDITWSPDGTSVLFGGLAGDSTPTQFPTVAPVLFSFAPDGTTSQLLVGTPLSEPLSAQDAAFVWDVPAGRQLPVLISALPPALTYRWTADGQIVAAQPLPTPTSSPTASPPAGTLAQPSDGTFSAWQPGTFVPISPWDSAHNAPMTFSPPLAEGYIAVSNQWSPDGRYLAMGLHTQRRVPPEQGQSLPALNPRACEVAGFVLPGCPKQADPLPDATFASIAQLARTGTHYHSTSGVTATLWIPVPVAWRADGTQIATILPDDGFNAGNQQYVVSIFRADETQPTARLPLSCPGEPCRFQWQPGNAGLAWSPAGDRLALLDPDSGLITIWGGSALPK